MNNDELPDINIKINSNEINAAYECAYFVQLMAKNSDSLNSRQKFEMLKAQELVFGLCDKLEKVALGKIMEIKAKEGNGPWPR